jgi:hypothetical protein
MTTKTTYAMFAVAAIAAMSFSLTPAFASSYASESVRAPTGSGTAYSGWDNVSCGTGTCIAQITASSSQNYVTFWYGMDGSNNRCDVESQVYGMGAVKTYNWGNIAGKHSERINEPVNANQRVVIANTYSNCT